MNSVEFWGAASVLGTKIH